MKAISKAVVSAMVKAPFNSLRNSVRRKGVSDNAYLVYLTHPDDEILVAAFCSRLKKYSKGSDIGVLTDGSGNTDKDRMEELGASYRLMGYFDKPEYLISEDMIYALARLDVGGAASDRELKKLALTIRGGISSIEKKIRSMSASRVVTNAFEGGHFVHDLMNFMVLRAARESGVDVYETSQYSLVPHQKTTEVGIREAINDTSIQVSSCATCNLGIPLTFSKGFDDEALGVKDGVLDVGISEILLKNRMKKVHGSQRHSLGRASGNVTHADFSHESFSLIPADRDFSCLPVGALPLYEFCDWRKSHLTFGTFKRLVEIVDSI